MDPKLKKYLEKEFSAIRSNMASVKTELKRDIIDLTQVIKDFSENTSGIIEKFENYHSDLVNRTGGLSHRVDFIQNQVEEIKRKINAR
ncbi:MAG: hypothetical protein Q7R89_01215 [bacterium]|nr:hypothetical protein [bacterium]